MASARTTVSGSVAAGPSAWSSAPRTLGLGKGVVGGARLSLSRRLGGSDLVLLGGRGRVIVRPERFALGLGRLILLELELGLIVFRFAIVGRSGSGRGDFAHTVFGLLGRAVVVFLRRLLLCRNGGDFDVVEPVVLIGHCAFGLGCEQRHPVRDGDLVVVRVDFRKRQEALAIAAIFDERGLQRRLYPRHLGQIDVAL